MIDVKLLREHPEAIRANYARRHNAELLAMVDELIAVDTDWRRCKGEEDILRARRNKLSQAINEAKKTGGDAQAVLAEAKRIPEELAALESERKALEQQQQRLAMRLPNILQDTVPDGADEQANVVVKTWGEKREPGFELKPHGEIAEALGSDFTRAAKISGSGFYFLNGQLGLLNRALIEFAVQHLTKKGLTYVEPPLLVRRDAYAGVVSLGDFETVQYGIDGEDLKLIATAEHPLVAQFWEETLHPSALPIKLAGYSMCFRREIGSKGVDTKGIFRTHQFNKVEQVAICKPEDAEAIHRELQRNCEEVFEALELPYRVIHLCGGDTGSASSSTYDTEVWMPRGKEYREVGSASNCLTWQSRRLNLKYQAPSGTDEFTYTLNATAIATGRALVAILENYQQADGSVLVPKVLVPLMGGVTVLKPVR